MADEYRYGRDRDQKEMQCLYLTDHNYLAHQSPATSCWDYYIDNPWSQRQAFNNPVCIIKTGSLPPSQYVLHTFF